MLPLESQQKSQKFHSPLRASTLLFCYYQKTSEYNSLSCLTATVQISPYKQPYLLASLPLLCFAEQDNLFLVNSFL